MRSQSRNQVSTPAHPAFTWAITLGIVLLFAISAATHASTATSQPFKALQSETDEEPKKKGEAGDSDTDNEDDEPDC